MISAAIGAFIVVICVLAAMVAAPWVVMIVGDYFRRG